MWGHKKEFFLYLRFSVYSIEAVCTVREHGLWPLIWFLIFHMDKSFNLSKPQFCDLWNGDNDSTYLHSVIVRNKQDDVWKSG